MKDQRILVMLLFPGLVPSGDKHTFEGPPKRREPVTVDKASCPLAWARPCSPAFSSSPVSSWEVKVYSYKFGQTPFKQHLFSSNQSQKYTDFLTLLDKAFKYKHIREILMPIVVFICAAFWDVAEKIGLPLHIKYPVRKKWQDDRLDSGEGTWQTVTYYLCMVFAFLSPRARGGSSSLLRVCVLSLWKFMFNGMLFISLATSWLLEG